MIRWLMIGPVDKLETKKRARLVNRSALAVSQCVDMNQEGMCNTNRRLHPRENPQTRGSALTVHHDTRSKTLVDRLSA